MGTVPCTSRAVHSFRTAVAWIAEGSCDNVPGMKTTPAVLALALTAVSVTASASSRSLPFIDGDYDRAVKESRDSHRPLVIEVWAPW